MSVHLHLLFYTQSNALATDVVVFIANPRVGEFQKVFLDVAFLRSRSSFMHHFS